MTVVETTWDAYRATVRRREADAAAMRAARRDEAWRVAHEAAAMLRGQFGASRVVVFGSLVEDGGRWFGAGSDIDLAAWGIPTADYLVAVARLQDVSTRFSIDLVAMERCPERLRDAIALDGVDL